MLTCLQKTMCRLAPINSIFMQGRCLTTKLSNLEIRDANYLPLIEHTNDCKIYNVIRLKENLKTSSKFMINEKMPLSLNLLNTKLLKFQSSQIPYASENVSTSNGARNSDGPSEEELTIVFERLRQTLPKTLVDSHDFSIYNPNLVFENNIRGKRTVGLYPAYVTEVAKLRIYCHLKFAFVKFDVIKITKHEEDSTVKVRWRISGMTGTRVLFTFWRYKLWEMKKMFDQQESWLDGFSTFYVGSDGLVYRHVADKVIPDENREPNIATANVPGAKLMLFLGLSSEISPFLS